MTPEGEILRSILDYLAVEKIWAMRLNTGAIVSEYKGRTRFHRYGRPGCADILASFNGEFVWLECKTANGKQSDAQKEFEAEVKALGHYYFVVRSIDDVKTALVHAFFENLKASVA